MVEGDIVVVPSESRGRDVDSSSAPPRDPRDQPNQDDPPEDDGKPYCPTLTKGSKWQVIEIWESDVFRSDLAYSTSNPSLEQKLSSCWKIFKLRHNDIALMSIYIHVQDRHILVNYEKCHFKVLLPFVRVRQHCIQVLFLGILEFRF